MKKKFTTVLLFALFIEVWGCSTKTDVKDDGVVFRNDQGSEIVLTNQGATVSGKFYPATDCSTEQLRCIKYGTSFAIIAPLSCATKFPYDWRVTGLRSVFIAPTPHNPYRVLMSTTYGGMVAYTYEGQVGVTELYYESSVQLGKKDVWQGLASFNYVNAKYKKIGDGFLFTCREQSR